MAASQELQGTNVAISEVDCGQEASISDQCELSESSDNESVSSFSVVHWEESYPELHRGVPQQTLQGDTVATKPVPSPVCSSAVNRNLINFTRACKSLCEKIIQLESKYGEVLVPSELLRDLKQTKWSMEEKEIMVNVFGEQNCGKSTFLNALLGNYFLPINKKSCTALIVKIRHSDEVHPMCDDKCAKKPLSTKHCPKLHELRKSGQTVITGRDTIYEHLQTLNDKFRRQRHDPESQETIEVPNLVLNVHLPILNEGCPDGWTVTLVDNPGFGEDKEYITQLASASLVTSSAYIYLMTTENVEGKAAANFFKMLQEKDPAALCDGRLIIGITQVDTLYKDDDDTPESLTEEEVVEDLLKSIESATGTKVGRSVVVPVSAKWSLGDREVTSWLTKNCDCDTKPDEIVKGAVKALERRHKTPPIGQDETIEKVIEKMSSKELLETLGSSDGMSVMKARIQNVIGRACIQTWAKKLYRNFFDFCERINECIRTACEERDRHRRSKKEEYAKARALMDELEKLRSELENEVKSDSAVILQRLEESYFQDVEESSAPETGKIMTESLVSKFKTECQKRFKTSEFESSEFQACVRDFLIESRPKLQAVFGDCGFKTVDACVANLNEDTVKRVSQMGEIARRLLGHDLPLAIGSTTSNSDVANLVESSFVQSKSTFDHSRNFFSDNVEEKVLQTATYAPSTLAQEESFGEALDSNEIEFEETEVMISTEETFISSIDDEHRELGVQATQLRDLTDTGDVPVVSSSWWKVLQIVAKDMWDQLKQKATNLYTSIKGSSGKEFHARTDEDGNASAAPSERETFEDSTESPTVDNESSREHIVPQNDDDPAVGDSHTTTMTVAIEKAATDTTTSVSIPHGPEGMSEDGVSTSVESGVVIDNLVDEFLLESAISRIQNVLEEECDRYFKDIAPKAIKFFHEKYRLKIKTNLAKFDKEYKTALSQKAKDISKVKERESALKKTITKYREHQKNLTKMKTQLLAAWESLGWTLEGHDTRTPEQIEEAKQSRKRMELALIDELTSL